MKTADLERVKANLLFCIKALSGTGCPGGRPDRHRARASAQWALAELKVVLGELSRDVLVKVGLRPQGKTIEQVIDDSGGPRDVVYCSRASLAVSLLSPEVRYVVKDRIRRLARSRGQDSLKVLVTELVIEGLVVVFRRHLRELVVLDVFHRDRLKSWKKYGAWRRARPVRRPA